MAPIQVAATSDWSSVAAGLNYGLAVKTDNSLWAWGNNSYGQLGVLDFTHRSSLIQVGSLNNWSQVAAGQYHSLAIKTDGTLWSWGNNSFGQLGNDTYYLSTNYSSPAQVGTINRYVSVYAMNFTTLANLS